MPSTAMPSDSAEGMTSWRTFELDKSASHQALVTLAERKASLDVREAFAANPGRAEALTMGLDGLLVDMSKQRWDEEVVEGLLALAEEADVKGAVSELFGGAHVNGTEGRAVMHMALRGEAEDAYAVDGQDVMGEVLEVRRRMLAFVDEVHDRFARGEITDVVNIGIGGSDLGPAMAVRALRRFACGPSCHFVSNVDGAHVESVLDALNPKTTLVVVVSKTFTTQETMANAALAKAWLERGGVVLGDHLAAVSTNLGATRAFGVRDERTFGFSDWVGGRYSMWGPVGLTLALSIGRAHFNAFLGGAREVDRHMRQTSGRDNLPWMLALLGHWNQNVRGFSSHAVIPYAEDLARLPAYLQQADMESNGKSITRSGTRVSWPTGTVVWGEPGTNSQHAFFQLLHQGTSIHPVDFIAFNEPTSKHAGMHTLLLSNALAQAKALLVGREAPEGEPHRSFEGNRPSTFWLFDRLDPKALGQLVALHEHRIFVQGVLWGIASFDQWGVELGKAMANELLSEVQTGPGPATSNHDPSTAQLLRALHEGRAKGAGER